MADFSFTDIGIMALIIVSTFIGLYRGLFRELITVIIWVAGIILAYSHGKELGDQLTFISSDYARVATGMSVIFVAVSIVGMIVKILAFKILSVGKASGFDRFLGAAFGAVRGLALIVIALIVATGTPLVNEPWYQDSDMIPPLEDIADDLSGQVPQKWRKWEHPNAGAAEPAQTAPVTPPSTDGATTTTAPATTVTAPATVAPAAAPVAAPAVAPTTVAPAAPVVITPKK